MSQYLNFTLDGLQQTVLVLLCLVTQLTVLLTRWINASNIGIHSGRTSGISGSMESTSPLTATLLFCLNQAGYHLKQTSISTTKHKMFPNKCATTNKVYFCVRRWQLCINRWQLCIISGQLCTDGELFDSTLMLHDKLFYSNFWLWWMQWDPTRQSGWWHVFRCIFGKETFFTINIGQRGLLLWVSIKRYYYSTGLVVQLELSFVCCKKREVIIHINKGTKWWERNFILLVWSSCLASQQWMWVLRCLWYSMEQFASCWFNFNLINVNYDTHLDSLDNFVFISSCFCTKTIWSIILVHWETATHLLTNQTNLVMLWQDGMFYFITMRCTKSNQPEWRVGLQIICFRLKDIKRSTLISIYIICFTFPLIDLPGRNPRIKRKTLFDLTSKFNHTLTDVKVVGTVVTIEQIHDTSQKFCRSYDQTNGCEESRFFLLGWHVQGCAFVLRCITNKRMLQSLPFIWTQGSISNINRFKLHSIFATLCSH